MAEELVLIKDIETEQMRIGDKYELHFTIQNIFQEIAGWFAPTWSEEQKQNKIQEMIQKLLDESAKKKWYRILSYKVDGNDLILRIGISNLPQVNAQGQLAVIPLVVLIIVGAIIAIGTAIGINVAINKAFKIIDKTSPILIASLVGLGLFSLWLGRPQRRAI